MSEAKPPIDIVERAAAAVCGAAVPGPPAEMMAATFAAVQTQVAAARRARRRRRVMRNVLVCGALALTVGLLGLGFVGGGSSAQASLLEALDNQAKAKSFRAVITTTLADPPAGMPPTPEQRMFIQGENGRIETGDLVVVGDGKRMVMFNAKAKTAQTFDMTKGVPQVPKDLAGGIQRIRDAVAGKAKVTPVAAVEIGGKKRPGFKVTGVTISADQTGDVTYWLDEERKLPLRYEMTFLKPVAITTTTDFFAFDEKLDAKLFDLTIPADFKQEELKMPAFPRPARAAPAEGAPPVAPAKVAVPRTEP